MNIKISVMIPPELYAAIVDEQAKRRKANTRPRTLSAIVTEFAWEGASITQHQSRLTDPDERAVALTRAQDRCIHCGSTRAVILEAPQGGCPVTGNHVFREDKQSNEAARTTHHPRADHDRVRQEPSLWLHGSPARARRQPGPKAPKT